ncbi:MAG: type I polyketide synthase [Gammaproteobacteria bacterium]
MAQTRELPLAITIVKGDAPVGYELALHAQRFPFLLDHRVRNSVVVPGTAFIEMALAVGYELLRPPVLVLEDICFHQALFLPIEGERLLRCVLVPGESGEHRFLIESRSGDHGARQSPWTSHVTGRFAVSTPTLVNTVEPLAQVRVRCPEFVSHAEHYSSFEQRNFEFGDAFRAVIEAWRGESEAVGKIGTPDILVGDRLNYYFHPAILDACLQVFAVALPPELASVDDTYLPIAVERFRIHQLPGERLWSHVRIGAASDDDHEVLTADVSIFSEAGALIAEVQGLKAKRLTRIAPCAIRERVRDCLYEMVWEECAQLATSELSHTANTAPNRWLLLADNGGVAQALSARLVEHGQKCQLLHAPDPLTGDSGLERIRDALSHHGNDAGLRGVIHLWSLNAELEETSDDGDFEAIVHGSCGSALHAIQAVAQASCGHLWLVTRAAQACCSTDDAAPMAGALWGLGRVIAQEHPTHWGGMVDLDATSSPDAIAALAKILLGDPQRMGIAVRDSRFYVPRLQPLMMSKRDDAYLALRDDRSYLITGGLGGVGRQLALWLAKQGARHLTLLVRTPVASATGKSTPDTEARSRCLCELQSLGVAVHIAVGDVSDADTVRALINRFGDTLPALAGVVHAAGVVDDGVLTNQSALRLARVFAPKAQGAWNLHRCTANLQLDFFVLCSSIAAVLGSPGQANYAAANALLDSLAQHRRAHGNPAIAINWGPWENVGMMVGMDEQRLITTGIRTLPVEEACEAFALALVAPSTNLLAANIDWQRFAASDMGRPLRAVIAGAAPTASAPQQTVENDTARHVGAFFNTVAGQRDAQLLHWVQAEVARVLGLESNAALDPREPLLNFGFESLMALRLKNNLEAGLGCALPATLAFDYPTISGITRYLAQRLDEQSANEAATAAPLAAGSPSDDAVTTILAELERLSLVSAMNESRQPDLSVYVSNDTVKRAQ